MSTTPCWNDDQMREVVKQNLSDYLYEKYNDIVEASKKIAFPHNYCDNQSESFELNFYLQDCRILIVTANSVEQSVVTHCLKAHSNADPQTDNGAVSRFVEKQFNYQIATVKINNADNIKIAHLHAANISSHTDGGSQDAVTDALKRFKPNLVISIGCAYGWDPSKEHGQKLGDVLLSKELIAYSERNQRIDNKLRFKEDVIYSISKELKPFLQFYEEEQNWVSVAFKAYYGSLLVGSSTLSDAEEKSRIGDAVNQHNRIPIGGEMEGSGLRKACNKQNIPWLVIKGISDWGMEKNSWDRILELQSKDKINKEELSAKTIKDSIQAIATEHAFETLMKILEHNPQLYKNHSLLGIFRVHSKRFVWLNSFQAIFASWKMRLPPVELLRLLFGLMLVFVSSFGLYLTFLKHERTVLLSTIFPPEPLLLGIVLCCILLFGLFHIYSALCFSPVLYSKETTHLQVYRDNRLILENTAGYPLYQTEATWIDCARFRPTIISQKVTQRLSIGEAIFLEIPENLEEIISLKKSKASSNTKVKFLKSGLFSRIILQLSYLTPDNICYFHILVFYSKNKYVDKIFRVEGHRTILCATCRKVLADAGEY